MVKVISLSENAYGKLSRIKMNKSFSEVIIELVEGKQRKNLREFSGWILKEEGAKMKKETSENRKKQKMKEVKL